MAEYEKKVRDVLKQHGCYCVRKGKGTRYLQNDLFEVLHLQQTDDLSSFTVKNDAYGLLACLWNTAKV